jgi:gas vesicle protein
MKRGLIYGAVAVGAGALGALAGVLFAPASGPETRRRMTRRITEEADALRRKGREAFDELSDAAAEKVAHGKERLAELIHR